MPLLRPTAVEIASVVYEFMHIRINDHALKERVFEYEITNPGNEVFRKGSFPGPETQLRLSHLRNGKYLLKIRTPGNDFVELEFEKNSDNESGRVLTH